MFMTYQLHGVLIWLMYVVQLIIGMAHWAQSHDDDISTLYWTLNIKTYLAPAIFFARLIRGKACSLLRDVIIVV